MVQNPSWRHHYLPEFYLKRWAGGKGSLVEYSRPWGDLVKPKLVHPSATGFIDRRKELQGLSREVAHSFEERFFSPVDSKAADVLTRIERKETDFSGVERSAWARFVLSLVFRTPEIFQETRTELTEQIESTAPKAFNSRLRQTGRRKLTPEQIRHELCTADDIARAALHTLVATINSQRVGETLINMHWGALTAPIFAPALLTSDRPIYWEHGLSHPEFHLLLPIGPKLIFYAAQPDSYHAFFGNPQQAHYVVEVLNEHVTRRAVKYVYGNSDQALPYVQERMGREPMLTIPDVLLERRADMRRKRAGKRGRS